MKKILFHAMLLIFAAAPLTAHGAAPYSNQPAYQPNIPVEFGSGSQSQLVPLPPHLPEYLPNGAINLDEVWVQDGGARLYWNSVIIPRQLKMAGATWIDPALVPQLMLQNQTRPARSYRKTYKPRAKASKPVKNKTAALTTPAIPLPVTPVAETKPAKPKQSIPPLKASQARETPKVAAPANPGSEENRLITPPPLQ